MLKYFDIRLTRSLAERGLGNSIKFFGGAIVGGITLVSFSTSCTNFQKQISNTPLSDPHYIDQSNVIDVQFNTLDEVEKEFETEIDIQDGEEIVKE